jgi:hypothetical protein
MLWSAFRFRKNRDDVSQRLFDLRDEITANQFALLVPADLSGDENLPALRGDAVGVTFRRSPARGL